MQKVIEKSLKTAVLQQITELNRTNAQFFAMLRKLSAMDHQLNQTFSQKLDSMRVDIKEKIRLLASNVDLMYKLFDRKIAMLIRKIQNISSGPQHIQQQFRVTQIKIKQLEEENKEMKSKYNAVVSQNQYLKNKNHSLIEELQALSKKKANNSTSDSSRNMIPKMDLTQDIDNSLDNQVSPIQHPVRVNFKNELTFNNSTRNIGAKKYVRSQQNSFSQQLIKQQNSFQPSYGTDYNNEGSKSNRLHFGCMPAKQTSQYNTIFKGTTMNKRSSNEQPQNQRPDQSHRLNFLINNLQDLSQQSFVSTGSRQSFQRGESNGKSVLSKGIVKKYHI